MERPCTVLLIIILIIVLAAAGGIIALDCCCAVPQLIAKVCPSDNSTRTANQPYSPACRGRVPVNGLCP